VSQENVEVVRRAHAGSGSFLDSEAVRPDAEFDFTDLYPDQPVLRGVEKMREFRDKGPWGRSVRFVAERYLDVDEERVLVFTRVTATGQGSGATLDSLVARLFTVRDGMIVAVKVYSDRAQALEAVGLKE
jgi:ketosteroid isomerase-like protein